MKELKETINNLKKSWKFVRNQKQKMILYLILILITVVISVVVPLLAANLILGITGGIIIDIIKIAVIIFLVEFTGNICMYFAGKIFAIYIKETVINMQMELARETLKLEVLELDKKSSGIFIDRLNKDVPEISQVFIQLTDGITEMLGHIGILVAVFFINIYMFLFLLFSVVIVYLLEKRRMSLFFDLDKKRRKLEEKNTGLISELIRGLRDIKVLNVDKNFLRLTEDKLTESNDKIYEMSQVTYIFQYWVNNARNLLRLLFVLLGIYLYSMSLMSLEVFVIVYMYYDRIISLLRYFTFVVEKTKKYNVAANRVFEVLEDSFEKEKFGNKIVKKINGDFEFKNVSFSYDGERSILTDVSFKIKANTKNAFVGKSGGGKSTIFSLIDKLYEVDSGSILIDNVDIKELSKDSIRDNISIITQSPYIFNLTIRENLKLVKDDMTDEEMIRVCKLAYLHDFITSLKDGYDTKVGEGGLTLSGGQRQRLAIARALLKNTEIILFDEATSALDNEAQDFINKAIKNLEGEYTILIIAHRLSTVVDCENIILIEGGKNIASGSHKKLLKDNIEYKKLYEKELV